MACGVDGALIDEKVGSWRKYRELGNSIGAVGPQKDHARLPDVLGRDDAHRDLDTVLGPRLEIEHLEVGAVVWRPPAELQIGEGPGGRVIGEVGGRGGPALEEQNRPWLAWIGEYRTDRSLDRQGDFLRRAAVRDAQEARVDALARLDIEGVGGGMDRLDQPAGLARKNGLRRRKRLARLQMQHLERRRVLVAYQENIVALGLQAGDAVIARREPGPWRR